ncbi:X-ray repair cross-complementing protein 6, partial [Nowakowskiella sp. JEL0078]
MSLSWNYSYNDEDDEYLDGNEEFEEKGNAAASWMSRDGLLFVIDTSPLMHTINSKFKEINEEKDLDEFVSAENLETRFQQSLKVVETTLTNKIIQSETDLVGVLLFGTKRSRNTSNFENLFLLQNLDVPDANRILELQKLQKCNPLEKTGDASAEFGSSDDFNIGEMFCFDLFYKDIIQDEEPETGTPTFYDASIGFEELSKEIKRKETKKRSYFSIPFVFGEEFAIGVSGYIMFVDQKKPPHSLLDVNNREAKPQTTFICKDTGTVLLPTDLKYVYNYGAGGDRAIFGPDEVKLIKTFGDPGLVLLGFKPRSALRDIDNVNHSLFIYPDES